MGWLHLVLVACFVVATAQSRGRSRGSRGRGPPEEPPHWYQEGRVSRTILRQAYVQNPPTVNSSVPVKVGHSLSLIAISGYSGFGHIVTFRAKVQQVWQDPRLVWDSTTDAANIDKLHFRSDDIWTPETEMFPSLDDSQHYSRGKHDVIVTSRGGVTWTYDTTYRIPCSAGITLSQHTLDSPPDPPHRSPRQHTCTFRVWNPNYRANELAIVPISDIIKLTDYVTTSSADVTATQVDEELLTRVDEKFSVIKYNFTFETSA